MIFDIPQFTDPDHCARCRGCCIFHGDDDTWLARASDEEIRRAAGSCGRTVEEISEGHWIKTLKQANGEFYCALLSAQEHDCQAYLERPLECGLYPFLISNGPEGIKLCVHLACPFAVEHLGGSRWRDSVAALRAFFCRSDVRQYLRTHRTMFANYSSYYEQVEDVFLVRVSFPEMILKEKERYEAYVAQQQTVLSAMAFADLCVWQDAFDIVFEEIAGTLCVFARQPIGDFLLLPPLGPRDAVKGAIDLVFERMCEGPDEGGLARIENVPENLIDLFPAHRFVVTERGADHVYERETIAQLKGNAFKSQRHDVNLVQRDRELSFRSYLSTDRSACEQLFDRWLDSKRERVEDSLGQMTLEDARLAHSCLWDYAQELGACGRVVLADGELVAYTFGCPLTMDTFCVLAEVTDPLIKGLAAYTFNAFAQDPQLRSFRYLNAMDDQGLPGLARAKMSWHPVKRERIYSVRKK